MAKKGDQAHPTTSSLNQAFTKGMMKDLNVSVVPEGAWRNARNAVNNAESGQLGTISNEPSNEFCTEASYKVIGKINLTGDYWVIFSTDNTNNEIGIFKEGGCQYRIVVNDSNTDKCLNFHHDFPIKGGVSKQNFDCSYEIYWADSNNPDRAMTIINHEDPDATQYTPDTSFVGSDRETSPGSGCFEYTPDIPLTLDCDRIRLATKMSYPTVKITKGVNGGQLLNGSYQVIIAYTQNEQRVTDYFTPSNVQPLFDHENVASSIDVEIIDAETEMFDEMEVVIIRTANGQAKAYKMGIYNTNTKFLSFDYMDESLPTIPLEFLPLNTSIYEKSEGIFENGEYMLRLSPTGRFDFNYQPLANLIRTKWKLVEYGEAYYKNGGNKTSLLRDEQYPFFIKWIYDTGDKTPSFHIPGRNPRNSDRTIVTTPEGQAERWKYFNTGVLGQIFTSNQEQTDDGGYVIAEGEMGYWESSEEYPDEKSLIWNPSEWAGVWPNSILQGRTAEDDLCGKQIRHHKMPDATVHDVLKHHAVGADAIAQDLQNEDNVIRILGVEFENIMPPVDNDGNYIPNIVGYEILVGSREGNKSIVAKGMFNNMRRYAVISDTGGTVNGLYQNYPFNHSGPEVFLSQQITGNGGPGQQPVAFNPMNPSSDPFYHTFHSPDTQFRNPFLSPFYVRLYGELQGQSLGELNYLKDHPKHKFITDAAFYFAAVLGLGLAILNIAGKRRRVVDLSDQEGATSTTAAATVETSPGVGGFVALGATQVGNTAIDVVSAATEISGVDSLGGLFGPFLMNASRSTGSTVSYNLGGILGIMGGTSAATNTLEHTPEGEIGFSGVIGGIVAGATAVAVKWPEGINLILDLIRKFLEYREYALTYIGHGYYSNFVPNTSGIENYLIGKSRYLKSQTQLFDSFQVLNDWRPQAVMVNANLGFMNGDNSMNVTLNSLNYPPAYEDPVGVKIIRDIASRYGALKVQFDNQYGQLDGIRQVPGNSGVLKFTSDNYEQNLIPSNTGTFFPGDTYVGRYTEKNTFFPFYDWLDGQPDGYEFNYRNRSTIPYPRYWMDTTEYDASEFVSEAALPQPQPSDNAINVEYQQVSEASFDENDPSPGEKTETTQTYQDNQQSMQEDYADGIDLGDKTPGGFFEKPSNRHAFDRQPGETSLLQIKNAYIYVLISGVRDFFVESEVNVELRDWGDAPEKRYYDPYGYANLRELFDKDIIKEPNYYKYDQSLTISKLFIQMASWGFMQFRNYDPFIAETCYQYYPKRIIYSMKNVDEARVDFWKRFLANNYKDFGKKPLSIKAISKNGAMIFFERQSPIMFQGVDTLQTDGGKKITIGDGGLFSQPLQNIVNADSPYEYGSCQSWQSVINTPFGTFWMSVDSGKLFGYTGQLEEISQNGMNWWFSRFLPFKLLEDFPNYPLRDNTVKGIGCLATYDNVDKIVYFCKRDFKLREEFRDRVVQEGNELLLDGVTPLDLEDDSVFIDASWTVSYDPKMKAFISFHDWKPNFLIPSRNNFLSIKDSGIWRHGDRYDSYCNFYGVDYPFEVETVMTTGATKTILRNVSYILESYVYDANNNWHHSFDFNFDRAWIYNTEQISGDLRLNVQPFNDPYGEIPYPIVNFNNIDILYSKEENTYKFDQFWDITFDRGEFSALTRPMFLENPDGYTKIINQNYVNYNKEFFERKKFRHYVNIVRLARQVCGPNQMILKSISTNNTISMR